MLYLSNVCAVWICSKLNILMQLYFCVVYVYEYTACFFLHICQYFNINMKLA